MQQTIHNTNSYNFLLNVTRFSRYHFCKYGRKVVLKYNWSAGCVLHMCSYKACACSDWQIIQGNRSTTCSTPYQSEHEIYNSYFIINLIGTQEQALHCLLWLYLKNLGHLKDQRKWRWHLQSRKWGEVNKVLYSTSQWNCHLKCRRHAIRHNNHISYNIWNKCLQFSIIDF